MISIISPSRGRPEKSFDNIQRWIARASGDLQVIVSCDYSDDKLDDYLRIYKPLDEMMGDLFEVTVSSNDNVVQATNRACQGAIGDILVYVSDDFDCPTGWDVLIRRELSATSELALLKVDDCLQKFHVPVLTIPIMTLALYDRLGYFWHPEYKSMFVDEDLYWTCKNNGWLKLAPHLKFPHNHVSIGKAENDDTYRRSAANWDQGKEVFRRRKAQGFPL